MRKDTEGYSLLELVMVIIILGILGGVAIPRFIDLKGDASAASRDGVKGALNSAMQIVRSRWLAQGATGTVTPDGGTAIVMNTSGYPAVGGTSYDSSAECAALVGSLLAGPLPGVSTCGVGVVPLRTFYVTAALACHVHACPADFSTPIVLSATLAQ